MNVLDYILEGLEAELALERELGVRLVECDREVLANVPSPAANGHGAPTVQSAVTRPATLRATVAATDGDVFDFVFLHDKPLAPAGEEMMSKIAVALGRTLKTAPVVFEGERPKAKAYVVLGGLALKKWFPEANAAPGQWISAADAPNVLVTYSPAYILRFTVVTDAVKKIKKDMWTSIKSVLHRVSR